MRANKAFAPLWLLLAAIILPGVQGARAQTINTYAGGSAYLNTAALQVAIAPSSAAVAADGTVYFASGNTVDRLDPATATVTRVAGNGTPGFSGDGGPATNASLNLPTGVAVDGAGNLYIADMSNSRIRRVTPDGTISTVAGNGTAGFGGDDGPATSASLNQPTAVAVDGAGSLYIADSTNNRIRRVTLDGNIATVAGNGAPGFSGDGGPATSAIINSPSGVAVDGAGNLYIDDAGNYRIRRVTLDGNVATVAGNGTQGSSGDGGPATSARLGYSDGVAVDGVGNIYIADSTNYRVRRVTPDGNIATVAGNGIADFTGDGGPATSASLDFSAGVAVDGAGNLYIADQGNNRIRVVTPAGTISTVAGNGTFRFSGDGGPATTGSLALAYGVAMDGAGNLYIADTTNFRIRRVSPDGTISTVAGDGANGFSGDGGPATSASLESPYTVAVDGAGNLYIAEPDDCRIRKVDSSGVITTVAGNGAFGFSGDGGPATSASLASPYGVAVDGAGKLYIADRINNRIRQVTPDGKIATVAGNGTQGFSGDGGPATSASLNQPTGVAVDRFGNLYIGEQYNNRIRKVTPDGNISTVAGDGTQGFSGDGGPATSASLNQPTGVAADRVGNLYIADLSNYRIRRVTLDGAISTIAGNGTYGFSGDGGPATNASLAFPIGVAVDGAGNLYIADLENYRIRRVVGVGPPPDTTPPVIQLSVNGTLGTNGWYRSDVALSWTVTDPDSTVSSTTSCGSTTITSDTAGQIVTCNATSAGGSATKSVTIKRDTAPPTATITTPANGAFYPAGSVVNASYGCSDLPPGVASGVASCAGTAGIGSPIDTATGGSKTFVVNATDVAGNAHTPPPTASTSYTVTTPGASFSLAPASLSFAPQALGVASMAKTVTLTNTGTIALPITNITRTGAPNYQFRLQPPNTCGASVPVNSTCTISVEFLPTLNPPGTGPQAATLNVKAGGGGGTKSVSLSGTGVVASYTLAPTPLSFDNRAVGSTTYMDVTLTNTGTIALPITSITRIGSNQFAQTNTCGTSVPVSSTCTISVLFAPTSAGAKAATLRVTPGAGAAVQNVALTGTGIVPTYTLTPNPFPAFPNQPQNTSGGVQAVTLTNTGTIPLPINSITRTGTNPGQFLLTPPNTCGTSVPASSTCTISVVFHPTSAGLKTASLRVAVGGGAAAQTVALSGTGT